MFLPLKVIWTCVIFLWSLRPSFSLFTTLTFFLSLHFPSLFTFPLMLSYALSTSLLPQTLATSLPPPPPQSLSFALPPHSWHEITLSTSLHFPSLEPYPILRILHFSASSNPSHLSTAASNGLSLALPPQMRSTSLPSQLHSTFFSRKTISTILSTQTLSTLVPHETLSIRITLSPFLPPQTLVTSLTTPETLSSNPFFFLVSVIPTSLTSIFFGF